MGKGLGRGLTLELALLDAVYLGYQEPLHRVQAMACSRVRLAHILPAGGRPDLRRLRGLT